MKATAGNGDESGIRCRDVALVALALPPCRDATGWRGKWGFASISDSVSIGVRLVRICHHPAIVRIAAETITIAIVVAIIWASIAGISQVVAIEVGLVGIGQGWAIVASVTNRIIVNVRLVCIG